MRRGLLLPVVFLATVLVCPVSAESRPEPGAKPTYRLEIDTDRSVYEPRVQPDGKRLYYFSIPFRIRRLEDKLVDTSVPREEIVVREDGAEVLDAEIFQPRSSPLTMLLALDISKSMDRKSSTGHTKMEDAQKAANVFLDKLDPRSDCGLILFDHEVRVKIPPVLKPAEIAAHRTMLRQKIQEARPQGGTAYLDATVEALNMLEKVPGRKAIVVMTDGVDLSSRHPLDEVIKRARVAGIPVFTLGVGEPGKNDPVTTVLVLDHSGSMKFRAQQGDKRTKIEALHVAASRFVDLMRPSARATLLPFSTEISPPEPFGRDDRELTQKDKEQLKERIRGLTPVGGTKLYEAIEYGIGTVAAANRPGRRTVVVFTDGVDEQPGSPSTRVEQIIQSAREQSVVLYMLGLGQEDELSRPTLEQMRRMARETGGEFHLATNEQKLLDIFEELSIALHDDGIDETALTRLATRTGGQYYHARDAAKLQQIYIQLADQLQSTYTVTFPSRRQVQDGTTSGIEIFLKRGGEIISERAVKEFTRHGLVVPGVDPWIYLLLLSVLVVGLALPSLRRIRSSAEQESEPVAS